NDSTAYERIGAGRFKASPDANGPGRTREMLDRARRAGPGSIQDGGNSCRGRLRIPTPRRHAGVRITIHVSPHPDPIALFQEWFQAAHTVGLPEPSAVALATVGSDGQPSARMVLARGIDERGVVFYTNFQSRKGQELGSGRSGNAKGGVKTSLCFYWPPLNRQVRIEGEAVPVSDAEADA